jgi:hypothetical protein
MKTVQKFAESIIINLKDRFQDLPSIAKFDIFDPSSIPTDIELRRTYGDDQFSALLEMYGMEKKSDGRTYPAVINATNAKHEWDLFKDALASKGMLGHSMEKDSDFFETILTSPEFANLYPKILFLIRIKLVLWLNTAECERGFSFRTLIKSRQRASMGSTLLDILMRISLNGPEIDDSVAVTELLGASMQRFKEFRNRCPNRSGAGVARRKRNKTGSAIGQLMGWAAAVYNDGQDGKEDDAEVNGVAIPDVVVQTEEDEDKAEAAENAREMALLDSIPDFNPPAGWGVVETLPDNLVFPGAPTMCSGSAKFLIKKHVACKNARCEGGWEKGVVYMQEKSVKKGSVGFFSLKVQGVRGFPLYDLKKETYKKHWVLLVSLT